MPTPRGEHFTASPEDLKLTSTSKNEYSRIDAEEREIVRTQGEHSIAARTKRMEKETFLHEHDQTGARKSELLHRDILKLLDERKFSYNKETGLLEEDASDKNIRFVSFSIPTLDVINKQVGHSEANKQIDAVVEKTDAKIIEVLEKQAAVLGIELTREQILSSFNLYRTNADFVVIFNLSGWPQDFVESNTYTAEEKSNPKSYRMARFQNPALEDTVAMELGLLDVALPEVTPFKLTTSSKSMRETVEDFRNIQSFLTPQDESQLAGVPLDESRSFKNLLLKELEYTRDLERLRQRLDIMRKLPTAEDRSLFYENFLKKDFGLLETLSDESHSYAAPGLEHPYGETYSTVTRLYLTLGDVIANGMPDSRAEYYVPYEELLEEATSRIMVKKFLDTSKSTEGSERLIYLSASSYLSEHTLQQYSGESKVTEVVKAEEVLGPSPFDSVRTKGNELLDEINNELDALKIIRDQMLGRELNLEDGSLQLAITGFRQFSKRFNLKASYAKNGEVVTGNCEDEIESILQGFENGQGNIDQLDSIFKLYEGYINYEVTRRDELTGLEGRAQYYESLIELYKLQDSSEDPNFPEIIAGIGDGARVGYCNMAGRKQGDKAIKAMAATAQHAVTVATSLYKGNPAYQFGNTFRYAGDEMGMIFTGSAESILEAHEAADKFQKRLGNLPAGDGARPTYIERPVQLNIGLATRKMADEVLREMRSKGEVDYQEGTDAYYKLLAEVHTKIADAGVEPVKAVAALDLLVGVLDEIKEKRLSDPFKGPREAQPLVDNLTDLLNSSAKALNGMSKQELAELYREIEDNPDQRYDLIYEKVNNIMIDKVDRDIKEKKQEERYIIVKAETIRLERRIAELSSEAALTNDQKVKKRNERLIKLYENRRDVDLVELLYSE